jgi:hypothetical protein
MPRARYNLEYNASVPRLNPSPGDDVVDPDWEFIPYDTEEDSQELIPRGERPVMNDNNNLSQRQETWHEDDHEYYARLHVTLIGAGMENYPIFLGTVYWTVSRSSYGRGRFSV